MACKDHPNYGGKRTPRSDCKGCWAHYKELKNGEKEEAPDKAKEESPKQKTGKKVRKPPAVAPLEPSDRKVKEPSKASEGDKPRQIIGRVASGADKDARANEVPTVQVKPEIKIVLSKEISEDIDKTITAYVKEVYDRKIGDLRNKIAGEFNIEYEHLFIYDDHWHPNMMKALEAEGWQWMSHSWPLASRGILQKDYMLLKRIVKATNKPKPDFENEVNAAKMVKKYGGVIIKPRNTKAKK